MLHVIFVQPEIPPNTGNAARLCLAAGARLHLVGPLGFSLEDKFLARAGMDYWKTCDVVIWDSFEDLVCRAGIGRLWYLTTKCDRPYWEARFQAGDGLVFGRESKGLPVSLLEKNQTSCLTIPMQQGARSLNLATSAGIVLFEAVRQLSFSAPSNRH